MNAVETAASSLSPFWHWYVIVIVVASLAGCMWLLFANSRGTPGGDTGHVWDDDLSEYNNPLPRWWLNLFVITIVFAVGYLVMFPGFGAMQGKLGWTSRQEAQQRFDTLTAKRKARYAALAGDDVLTLSKKPEALTLGRAVFTANCAGCHGPDAHGAIGFPNLTDNDWLYGGEPDTIVATITNGRNGAMPAFGTILTPEQIDTLVAFVPHWSDPALKPEVREAGMKQFMVTCAACHGPEGKGNPLLGSANLTDDIWLHGGSREKVRETITNGRASMMPAHKDLLSKDEIRVVAAYVYSLSHGNGGDTAK